MEEALKRSRGRSVETKSKPGTKGVGRPGQDGYSPQPRHRQQGEFPPAIDSKHSWH